MFVILLAFWWKGMYNDVSYPHVIDLKPIWKFSRSKTTKLFCCWTLPKMLIGTKFTAMPSHTIERVTSARRKRFSIGRTTSALVKWNTISGKMGLLIALPTSKHKSSPYGIPETRGYIKFAFTACTHSKNKQKNTNYPREIQITPIEKHCQLIVLWHEIKCIIFHDLARNHMISNFCQF